MELKTTSAEHCGFIDTKIRASDKDLPVRMYFLDESRKIFQK